MIIRLLKGIPYIVILITLFIIYYIHYTIKRIRKQQNPHPYRVTEGFTPKVCTKENSSEFPSSHSHPIPTYRSQSTRIRDSHMNQRFTQRPFLIEWPFFMPYSQNSQNSVLKTIDFTTFYHYSPPFYTITISTEHIKRVFPIIEKTYINHHRENLFSLTWSIPH